MTDEQHKMWAVTVSNAIFVLAVCFIVWTCAS
jgi:hypothetical protein